MRCLIRYPLQFTGFLLVLACSQLATKADSNLLVRVMAANITSGNFQSYEAPGIRIFQGLKPDVVAIQEFKYNSSSASNDLRQLVNTAFGTNFQFYCEPSGNIPNGIVSRWPILAAGSWDDPFVGDRGFAWARIDLPGSNDLYVVSVHLYGTGTAGNRGTEAAIIKDNIQTNMNFPAGGWVVVGGDMNTENRAEAAIDAFKTFLSDSPIPDDNDSPTPDQDTNQPRSKPYDYVLPSFSLTNYLTPVVLPSHTMANGLVFDSGAYTPLSDVAPVVFGDSHVSGMQHMAVVKDFLIPIDGTDTNAPSIVNHPQSITVPLGSNATFSVVANGTAPLAYQWHFFGTNLAGATSTSYTRTNAQSAHAGGYSVVVSNSFGSVTSAVAQLTVSSAPFITAQPQSLSVNPGDNATFNVTASGDLPLSYQWRFGGVNIANATATSYTRTNAQLADAGNYTVVITNSAGSVTSSIAVLTVNSGGATNVVISQIYGGGGNTGATLRNDCVELFNPKSSTVNLATWSIQYASAAGTSWQVGNLRGSIQPYSYYLVQFGSTAAVGSLIPVADATNGINISASSGKLALVSNQTALSGSNPVGGASVVDFVGYGAANAFEGTAPAGGAPSGNNTTSTLRKNGGYADSNDNTNDFTTLTPPAPRNTASPANPPSIPAIAATLAVVSLTNNQFTFTVTGTAGSNYIVQATTNVLPTFWISQITNPAPFTFVYSNAGFAPQQFFRALSQP